MVEFWSSRRQATLPLPTSINFSFVFKYIKEENPNQTLTLIIILIQSTATSKILWNFSFQLPFKLRFNWNNALLLRAEKIPIFNRTQTIDKRRFKRLSHINLFPLLFQDYFDFPARYFSLSFCSLSQNWNPETFYFSSFVSQFSLPPFFCSFFNFETMAGEKRKVFSSSIFSTRSDKSIETTFCTGWSSVKRVLKENEKC